MKKQTILALSVMTLSCMLFNTGCAESKNDSAESKNDSSTTTLRTTAFEGAQGNCDNGGVKLEVLVDGVVDDAQTQYICNGANGQSERDIHNALVATSDEVGETCANGGVHMDFGLDANDNGTLDAGEILGSRAICHGTNGENGENGQTATIHTTAFEDVQGGCNYGGIKAEVLIDNVVQADQTQYICNGANVTNGQDGQNGTNGSNATIQTTSFTGAQGSCTNGGVKIDVLVDGVILPGQTQYICNGANGTNGQDGQNGTNGSNATIQTTSFTGTQGSCSNGGVKVDVLIDGVVQTGQTKYICNGVNGADGQDGQNGTNGTNGSNTTIQTTAFDDAQGDCTNGGVKIEVLVNGSVDDTQTQYICNGANGTNGTNGTNASILTTAFDNAQGNCNNGGVKIEVLIDGVVLVGQTQYICNGKVIAACRENETYNSTTNICTCDAPYVDANGNCEIKATCRENETYNSTINICTCDAPYVDANGNCEIKATCHDNETYNLVTNTCSEIVGYCTSNSACEANQKCNITSKLCETLNCAENQVIDNHECMDIVGYCTDNEDCTNKEQCNSSHRCEAISCPSGQVADNHTCRAGKSCYCEDHDWNDPNHASTIEHGSKTCVNLELTCSCNDGKPSYHRCDSYKGDTGSYCCSGYCSNWAC